MEPLILTALVADTAAADPTAVNVIRTAGIFAMLVGMGILIRRLFRK